jgi:hypothetical protein
MPAPKLLFKRTLHPFLLRARLTRRPHDSPASLFAIPRLSFYWSHESRLILCSRTAYSSAKPNPNPIFVLDEAASNATRSNAVRRCAERPVVRGGEGRGEGGYASWFRRSARQFVGCRSASSRIAEPFHFQHQGCGRRCQGPLCSFMVRHEPPSRSVLQTLALASLLAARALLHAKGPLGRW